MPTNPLIRKLEAFASLDDADKQLLEEISQGGRPYGARVDIIREGENPEDVFLILEGFACRYKTLMNGTRQIVAYLVPGDFCDLHVFILKHMDHSLATLSPCKIARIPRAKVLELTDRPAIMRALWWAALVDEATLREWILNVGARPAEQRVAHLLCELLLRLRTVGLADGDSYELPITQAELADTTGMTNVHMNRMLQNLRSDNLITLRGKSLVILDIDRLMEFSGFNPNYLHLRKENGRQQNGVEAPV